MYSTSRGARTIRTNIQPRAPNKRHIWHNMLLTTQPDPRVQRELWPGEEVLWSERPESQGARAARLAYASRKAREAVVDWLDDKSIATLALSPIVAAVAWVRHLSQSDIIFVITTRRLITFHGPELGWAGLSHCADPKIVWRSGQVGSVLFPHDSDSALDFRFDGVRDPELVVAAVSDARSRGGA